MEWRHDDWPGRDDALWDAMRQYVGLPDAPRPHDTSYAPYVSAEELEGDLCLVRGLSDGIARDDDGVIYKDRVEPGGRHGPSADEREARDAAARLLLAGSRSDCGEACRAALREFYRDLACLIRSGSASEADEPFELALMRRRGRKGPAPSNQLNTSLVMSLVSKVERDGCVDAAVADVTKQYDVSERTVWKLWEEEAKYIVETHRLIGSSTPGP
jgi:hypothetical protein